MSKAGVAILIDMADLDEARALLAGLDIDEEAVLAEIGGLGEFQTRTRVEETKTAPDGSKWPANIEGTPILVRSGKHLRDSISWQVGGGAVEWGSSWEFAHVHQYGATILPKKGSRLRFMLGGKWATPPRVRIPARPFVGLSADDIAEIRSLVTDRLGLAFGGAA